MKSMRILVLFGNVPLWGNERANIETLDQLQQRSAAVLFLIRRLYTDQSIQPELTRRGLRYAFVPYFPAVKKDQSLRIWVQNLCAILGGSWQLLRYARSFRATHVHIGSATWVLNFLPALVMLRLPVIFRAGEVPVTHHALWRVVWRFVCRRASAFVCDSDFIQREIVARGAPAEKCCVIYAPAPARATPSTGTSGPVNTGRPFTFLFVGQLSRAKGVDLLVQAGLELLQSHRMRLIVAGDYAWSNPFAYELRNRVERAALSDCIQFVGFVENIDSLYAQTDVHVAPSLFQEPYGLTVLEAKFRSVPSIIFPSGGMRELVQHGDDGWVCENNTVDALKQAMSHYLRQPQVAQQQGIAAQRSLNERLQVQHYGDRWAEVYARTC